MLSSRTLSNIVKSLSTISRTFNQFGSKKVENPTTCVERKKIVSHFKDVFTANVDLFCQGSPLSSVQTNTQILTNMDYLSVESPKLQKIIKCKAFHNLFFYSSPFSISTETIESKLLSEITPQIALQTLSALSTCLEGDEARLLKYLSEYFQKFFYLFDFEELQRVESLLMQNGKSINVGVSASMENEVQFKKLKIKMLNQHHTRNMLEQMDIHLPSGINAIFSKDDERITVEFTHTKQHLTILGMQHGDYQGIYKIKEHLLKDKITKHFIVELPPLKHYQFTDAIEAGDTKKDDKLKSKLFGGNTFSGGDASQSPPDQLLKYYGEIPILTGDMTKFYIEQYILHQKDQYRLNETERIIYSNEDGIAKPNEFLSFVYNQLSQDKHLDSKILLADLSIEDEIYQQIAGKTNQQIQAQFDVMKIVNLNEQINWAIRVGKVGCSKCSDGIKRGPLDIVNACGESDYDFKIREKNLAKQALNFMRVNEEAERFVMIVGNGHLVNLLKEIVSEYKLNEKEYKDNRKQGYDIGEYIADITKVKLHSDVRSHENSTEYLNKFSLYSAYFKTNRLLLPDELRTVQNLKDHRFFRENYIKQLQPDSFLPQNQRWHRQKGQDKCLALKQLNFA